MKKLKLGVVMDPIETINYKKDTTLQLLLAATEFFQLFLILQSDLYMRDGQPFASTRKFKVYDDAQQWFSYQSEYTDLLLDDLDVLLMRKDPPFNMEYIYSTYILEAATQTLVVNNPKSLRDCNEKIFSTQFPQCCPPLLVSCNQALLTDFYQQYSDVIFKPLDGMGGQSIFRVKPNDGNLNVILETLTHFGTQQIMAQQYISSINSSGDKRIILIDGEPIPYCLARYPTNGETRANLASGGKGIVIPLNKNDHWIAAQLKDVLKEKGLLFVGIDVIGDYLTEINVTSPTGIKEIDSAYDTNISAKLMQVILEKLTL